MARALPNKPMEGPHQKWDPPKGKRRNNWVTRLVPGESLGNRTGQPYVPYHVRATHPVSLPGTCARTSTRWFREKDSRKCFTPIPFVSISGKISGYTTCFWTAYPEQIVGSITSTVYKKLLRIVSRRHGYKYGRQCTDTLFRAAAYYTVTHEESFMDRILGIFKKKAKRSAHDLFTYAFSTLGVDKRFVIDQICSQILWLSFRAKAVGEPSSHRDKPYTEVLTASLSQNESDVASTINKWSPYQWSSQFWRRPRNDYRMRYSLTHSPEEVKSASVFSSETSRVCVEALEHADESSLGWFDAYSASSS